MTILPPMPARRALARRKISTEVAPSTQFVTKRDSQATSDHSVMHSMQPRGLAAPPGATSRSIEKSPLKVSDASPQGPEHQMRDTGTGFRILDGEIGQTLHVNHDDVPVSSLLSKDVDDSSNENLELLLTRRLMQHYGLKHA